MSGGVEGKREATPTADRSLHRHFGIGAVLDRVHGEGRLSKRKKRTKVILKGSGHATFYYEKDGPGKCGLINGIKEYVEMKVEPMCEPWRDPRTLEERKSNMIVALPLKMMKGNLKEYCGKEIIARYKGKTVRGLVAWDGCVKCDENGGLDFSSTVFGQIVGEDNCHAGRLDGLTWELTNDQLWDLNGEPIVQPTRSSGLRPAASKGRATAHRAYNKLQSSSRHTSSGTQRDHDEPTATSRKGKGESPEGKEGKKGKKGAKISQKKQNKGKQKPPEKKKKKRPKEQEHQSDHTSRATGAPEEEFIPDHFEADWENMHRDAPAYYGFED